MDALPKCGANYTPLTPLSFLKRASLVYANRTSIIYGDIRYTWRQTYERCCRLASTLRSLSISKNDVVSVLAPNTPAMYEMHFAVPMTGAVINTINTRLDGNAIATILKHSEAKILFVDTQYVSLANDALRLFAKSATSSPPVVILINDEKFHPKHPSIDALAEYEELVEHGDPSFVAVEVEDEWDPLALNYTSGTTSAPKGVVYSHRGAYVSILSTLLAFNVGTDPVYMWTVPMFHSNGWVFTWGIAAVGGTNVCLRGVNAKDMFYNIEQHKVTHMCGAPAVLDLLLNAKPDEYRKLNRTVDMMVGGSSPPAPILESTARLGFRITHGYGLTESTGLAFTCQWQPHWDNLTPDEQMKLQLRQGIHGLCLADADVKDLETMVSVPRDGKTRGEILIRGNSIMKGYLKDEKANNAAFQKGWFVTGDIGVVYPDGYVEIKDRSKDVIISGGENISSLELEAVLYKHPAIKEAAVVAMPHQRWGESPCAFVVLKDGFGKVTEGDLLAHCRKNLAGYMMPKKVHFMKELSKSSTGKIQKVELRALAKKLAAMGEPIGSRL